VSTSKQSLEVTSDKFGAGIERGTYIIYPRQEGHSPRLRVAKVLDIYLYTECGKTSTRLKVVGVEVYENKRCIPFFRPSYLTDPTNTVVYDKERIPQEYLELIAKAAGEPIAA
jgi:hypothetical protein